MSPRTTSQTELTRREILKRGAVFGGALVWATPVVQVVGMGRARAQTPSPGCLRYCMKWEVENNDPVQDTGVIDDIAYVTPCDDVPGALLWTSNWVALGQGPPGNNDGDDLQSLDSADEEGDVDVDTLSASETDGEPEASHASATQAGRVEPAQTNGPPGNGGGIPGNCITCDGSLNDDSTIAGHVQQLANTTEHGIQVYGDVNVGFYISYPPDCSLAVLAGGEPAAAAKCGGGIGPDSCNTDYVTDEHDDPCLEGNKRIFIQRCVSNGAISHLELIIDCCD